MTIDFKLYMITDRALCQKSSLEALIEIACKSGIRGIQLRERDLSALALYKLSKILRVITGRYHSKLLINDRVDIALSVGADGVQLKENSLRASDARSLAGENFIVGSSVHTLEGAMEAERENADFILFGPVFETANKKDILEPRGIDSLNDVSAKIKIPVFAVGGITPPRAKLCIDAGAYGVAAVSALMEANDMRKTIAEFKAVLGKL